LGVTVRSSPSALATAGRAISSHRGSLLSDWSAWVTSKLGPSSAVPHKTVTRQLALLLDTLGELDGPLRHDANDLWHITAEWYGRTAAERGLATGEVVEEFHYLRELLLREMSDIIAASPARQSMDTVLRINRVLDQGVAHAVVGYTDALVETLLHRRGVLVSSGEVTASEIERQLEQFERDLQAIRDERAPPIEESVSS